ncbi:MAG: hypothetical protein ABI091_20380, partial [Ferruginibacter sp.]
MKQIFLLLIVVTVASCYNQNDKDRKSEATISNLTVPKNYVDTIKRLEDLSTNLNYDSLGQLISKIEFNVKTDNLEDYADGKIPW